MIYLEDLNSALMKKNNEKPKHYEYIGIAPLIEVTWNVIHT